MPSPDQQLTVTPDDYAALVRVPFVWWNAIQVVKEIASALHRSQGDVRRRLARLKQMGLIEWRGATTLEDASDVRRIDRE